MTSICVLSNSHAACLKYGWDSIADEYPDLNLTFFAASQDRMSGLTLDGTKLKPNNEQLAAAIKSRSGGLDYVETEDFDAFILYGLYLRAYIPTNGFYSSDCLAAARAGFLSDSVLWPLLQTLRSATDKPIVAAHGPLQAGLEVESEGPSGQYVFGQNVLAEDWFSRQETSYLCQPHDTIINGDKTNPKYLIGAKIFVPNREDDGKGHKSGDRMHMNGEFGAKMLKSFFSELSV